MTESTILQKLGAVYAEAVLTFLDSGEAQWVTWDGVSHRFDFSSVELDEPRLPPLTFVDANWPKIVGDVAEIIDPDSPNFDADALRNAIETQIIDEGYGERLVKAYLIRIKELAALAREEVADESEVDDS